MAPLQVPVIRGTGWEAGSLEVPSYDSPQAQGAMEGRGLHRRAGPPYRLSFGHQKGQGPLWTWSLALPLYNGPCKGAMGNEGARTPLSYRVGLLHSQLVLLALASQEITIQQCMFPRGLCTQEPRMNTQEVLSVVGPLHWAG